MCVCASVRVCVCVSVCVWGMGRHACVRTTVRTRVSVCLRMCVRCVCVSCACVHHLKSDVQHALHFAKCNVIISQSYRETLLVHYLGLLFVVLPPVRCMCGLCVCVRFSCCQACCCCCCCCCSCWHCVGSCRWQLGCCTPSWSTSSSARCPTDPS